MTLLASVLSRASFMRQVSSTCVVVAVAGATACEPEVGSPCDPNPDKVLATVEVKAGANDLVLDVGLRNCTEALCLSTDGSRPYCTKGCESDGDCAEAGEGFTCQEVISFGPLACLDYVPEEECTDPATTPASETTCDCIIDGAPSVNPLKYCAAAPATIAARDEEFGRPRFVAP